MLETRPPTRSKPARESSCRARIGASARPHEPWTTERWLAYFRTNARRKDRFPWRAGARITEAERAAIGRSIAMFQLGESGEGRHIQRAAERYLQRGGDPAYLPALKLFIREEQRHGRDLGRFMDLAGITRWRRCGTDGLFRFMRHTGGLERAIAVLLTAELIAQVYYRALREATGSPLLKRLCGRILRDEVYHVRFQCERIGMLRRGRRGWDRSWRLALQRALFAGAVAWVYLTHGRALRAGGFGLARFWRACWGRFRAARAMLEPWPMQAPSPCARRVQAMVDHLSQRTSPQTPLEQAEGSAGERRSAARSSRSSRSRTLETR